MRNSQLLLPYPFPVLISYFVTDPLVLLLVSLVQ
jgi:hypothetical protein